MVGYPRGIDVDDSGMIYNCNGHSITDSGDFKTIAGDGVHERLDGVGTNSRFWEPYGVVVTYSSLIIRTSEGFSNSLPLFKKHNFL